MRDGLDRIMPMLGFKVRVTEKRGTNLGSLLFNKNLWNGEPCGRGACRTCAQHSTRIKKGGNRLNCITCSQKDEKRIDCRKRNILYESECALCNNVKKDGKEDLKDGKGYVVESSRSIYERAKEHASDREKQSEDSHQIKPWLTSH